MFCIIAAARGSFCISAILADIALLIASMSSFVIVQYCFFSGSMNVKVPDARSTSTFDRSCCVRIFAAVMYIVEVPVLAVGPVVVVFDTIVRSPANAGAAIAQASNTAEYVRARMTTLLKLVWLAGVDRR